MTRDDLDAVKVGATQVDSWLASAPAANIDYAAEVEFYDDLYGSSDDGWPFWQKQLSGSRHIVESSKLVQARAVLRRCFRPSRRELLVLSLSERC